MSWVPRKLAPQIRVVLSMINDSTQHQNLSTRESKPLELHLTPLDLTSRRVSILAYINNLAMLTWNNSILVGEINFITHINSFQQIVEEMLAQYNKILSRDQMNLLLSKRASENPLWLSIACEELRLIPDSRQLYKRIDDLRDGLLEYVLSSVTMHWFGLLLNVAYISMKLSMSNIFISVFSRRF